MRRLATWAKDASYSSLPHLISCMYIYTHILNCILWFLLIRLRLSFVPNDEHVMFMLLPLLQHTFTLELYEKGYSE